MKRGIIGTFVAIVLLGPAGWADPSWQLTEDKVIDRVLAAHLGIQAAEEDARAVAADLLAAKGVFDTTVSGQVDHRIDKSSSSAPAIFGTRTDTTRYGAGAKKTWPTGTETGLTFGNTRKRVDGSAFMNPLEYEAALEASIRQPLMKNVAGIVDRRSVAATREAIKSADWMVQRRVQEAVRGALGLYWDVVFGRREVQIAEHAVTAARLFLAITEERYRLGTADGTDLMAAKANVASREATVLAATTALEGAWRGLKTDLQIPVDAAVSVGPARPPLRRSPVGEEGAIALGLANRPDYRAGQARAEQLDLKLQMAQNKKWPSLDLVSSLALNQLATTSPGDAVKGMDNPNFLIGLQFQVPLENRRARGERDRARHEKARALIDLKALENAIVQEIHERLRTVGLRRREVSAQARAEALQAQRVALEQEEYQFGKSSSLEVIRAQDDHLAARLAVTRAQLGYTNAWLDYRLATAQLP